MTNTFSHSNTLSRDGRHPLTAALLSILPGLGQLYVGEKRKGILFLDVTAANFVLLWLMLFTEPMVKAVREMGASFHFHPNETLMGALLQAHFGSPASLLVLSMMVAFVLYAARDAYDKAFGSRRKKIYPECVLDFSEATSGSYIAHIALILSLAIMALFFVMPAPKTQITTYTFLDLEKFVKPVKPTVKTKAATEENAAHGRKTVHPQTAVTNAEPLPTESNASKSTKHAPAKTSAGTSGGSPSHDVAKQSSSNAASQTSANAAKNPQPVAHATHMNNPGPSAQSVVKHDFVPMPSAAKPAANASQNPIPNPLAFLQPAHNTASSAAPALQPVKIASANVPMPMLPFSKTGTNPMSLPSLMPHSTGSTGSSSLPVPAVGSLGGNARLSGGLPGGPTGITSNHGGGMNAPMPGKGLGTSGLGTTGPAPVAVNVGGTTGGSTSGAPGVVALRNSHGTSSGPGHGDGPAGHAPAPSKIGPGYGGNDLMSIMPVVGTGDHPGTKSGGNKGADRDTDNDPPGTGTDVVDFSKYMAELQRRIKKHWYPPHGPASKRVIVTFSVSRDGTLGELQIHRSAGSALEDNAAIKAVDDSAPLPPLPKGAPESVQIEFTFDYNVMSGNGGNWRRAF